MNRHGVFSKMTLLFGAASFSFLAVVAFLKVERAGLEKAHQSVCARIASDYVRASDPGVQAFLRFCFFEASQDVDRALSGDFGNDSRRALIHVLNERLSSLRVSHLSAFAPDETAAIWTSEAVDTGARGRIVDGEIVVTRTIEGSPAARVGVHPGDLVIGIDGVPVADAYDLESQSGVWEILRPDETRVFLPVQATAVQDHVTPYWLKSQERVGIRILKVPSFLPQAVDNDDWPRIRDEIGDLRTRGDKLVVDLRGNPGGSFPAMLRVLSALKCDGKLIGWIYRNDPPTAGKAPINPTNFLPDTLNTEPQLELLKRDGSIALAPRSNGPCFDGPLAVLIDQGTGSVAEIFAQALKERPRTIIAGWRSSGRVVMARWFQIAGLSEDYTVSVPVALYRSAKGEELERQGVSPDQLLTDDLKRWRSARDPWLIDVMKRLVSL